MSINSIGQLYDIREQESVINVMSKSVSGISGPASLWRLSGTYIAGNVPPAYDSGGPYTCDKTTVGAYRLHANDVDTRIVDAILWSRAEYHLSIVLVDRLWACSGFGPAAGLYEINTPGNLPARAGSGVGCQLWAEVNTALSGVSGTTTITYVDADNNTRETILFPIVYTGARATFPVPLVGASRGVKQVVSVNLSADWTAGSFGLVILKPICIVHGRSHTQNIAHLNTGWMCSGLPVIEKDACISFIGYLHSQYTDSITLALCTANA